MMRIVSAGLLLVVLAFPLNVYPGPPVTWLAAAALVAAGAGVALLSVPMVTVGGTLALIAHAVALLIARPAADPVGAITLGAVLTLLLLVVHFAARTAGAGIGAGVVGAQVREWILAVALGIVVAVVLALGGTTLAAALHRASLPVVVGAAALGAAVAMAGVVALVANRQPPPAGSA